jgi:hypothetical protein
MNKERADEHPIIFFNFSVYYFTFYHECPVFDRACPISPPLFQKGTQKLTFKNRPNYFIFKGKNVKKYGK